MNIAIASSGLGHVARGVETWACDTAVALSQTLDPPSPRLQRACHRLQTIDRCEAPVVTGVPPVGSLGAKDAADTAATTEERFLRSNVYSLKSKVLNVTLFSGAPLAHPVPCHVEVLPCLKRGNPTTQQLSNWFPGWAWRWGFKDTYGWEQFTFWMVLWPKLRRGKFDILHVQDPMVANWCRLFRKWGLVKTKEILAHGTEEPVEFLSRFDYVQHLAPWHLEQAEKKLEEKRGLHH
jgi:hypothetical protein